MTDLTRRSFLRWFGAASAVTAAGLLVPEAPKIVYSFLVNNPLAVPGLQIVSVEAILKAAYRPMLLELLDEKTVMWDAFRLPQAGRRVPWPGKVTYLEKPTASFRMDNITVPNRHMWGPIAIGKA